ncbi:MAG: DUF4884 domain-containing protein [Candidatus Cloacimonetes bacterium]|jgi:hypothetical protein|nr:DUF4884 domain-containing protein [Candidatus Cloacimonadota bacterium]
MKILQFYILVLFALLFTGCAGKAIRTTSAGEGYQVDFLFEIDGTRVYRFEDAGEYIYFASRPSTFTRKKSGDATIPVLRVEAEE